jgi:hypothetical protein
MIAADVSSYDLLLDLLADLLIEDLMSDEEKEGDQKPKSNEVEIKKLTEMA